jgi:hypothetical protein
VGDGTMTPFRAFSKMIVSMNGQYTSAFAV